MKYSLERSAEILERTPRVLKTLLSGLSEEWVINNEGPDTFSPFDVVGHLVHGEKTAWRERANLILEFGTSTTFPSFDRFAQFEDSKGKTLDYLLDEFERLRNLNMEWFRSLKLSEADLDKNGAHPSLGMVTLRQLLSTWVIHDLVHLAQVARVMAKQYKSEMGPWVDFFRIMSF